MLTVKSSGWDAIPVEELRQGDCPRLESEARTELSDAILSGLTGSRQPAVAAAGEKCELSAAEAQMDHYLDAFDGVFRQFPVESHFDMKQQQALLQFQMIHERIASARSLAEDELFILQGWASNKAFTSQNAG